MSDLGSRYRPHRKDPDDEYEYSINWNGGSEPFLGVDTIATSTWTIPTGLTSALQTNTTTTTTAWIAGGTVNGGTVGGKYPVKNKITTVGGRTKEKTIYLAIKQQ